MTSLSELRVSLKRFAVVVCSVACMSSCYVTRLAFQQNHLINSRQPVDRVIASPSASENTKKKLILTREILQFAKSQGLNTDGAYNYFIQLEGGSVSYIVQAAYPDKLKSVTSWFPIVGRVPYLGFFKSKERDEKAAEFRRLGYDVTEGGASAFSSLGWFDDPLYSSMLRRPDSDLGHLLFHELTHRTFWIGDSVDFNENLAEFIGESMTRSWLQSKNKTDEIKKYEDRRMDRELLRVWVAGLKKDLEVLYKNPPGGEKEGGSEQLKLAKAMVFKDWQTLRRPPFKANDLIGDEDWNNASVLATSLYSPDTDRFEKAFACSKAKTAGEFLSKLEKASKVTADPFSALDSFCTS